MRYCHHHELGEEVRLKVVYRPRQLAVDWDGVCNRLKAAFEIVPASVEGHWMPAASSALAGESRHARGGGSGSVKP